MTFFSSLLHLIVGASLAFAVFTGAARAEGVTGGSAFIIGNSDVSLVSELGDATLSAELNATTRVPAPNLGIAPRLASPQERTDSVVGGDPFPNMRLALPLVVQSTVGNAVDASLASSVRSMSGPMVGVRPHPRTWGSMLGR